MIPNSGCSSDHVRHVVIYLSNVRQINANCFFARGYNAANLHNGRCRAALSQIRSLENCASQFRSGKKSSSRTSLKLSLHVNRCALLDDGSLKCFGRNFDGQLGLGDTDDRGNEVKGPKTYGLVLSVTQ